MEDGGWRGGHDYKTGTPMVQYWDALLCHVRPPLHIVLLWTTHTVGDFESTHKGDSFGIGTWGRISNL